MNTATRGLRSDALLPPHLIRAWNAAAATQVQQSPAAVQRITEGKIKIPVSLLPQVIGTVYRHKQGTSQNVLFRGSKRIWCFVLLKMQYDAQMKDMIDALGSSRLNVLFTDVQTEWRAWSVMKTSWNKDPNRYLGQRGWGVWFLIKDL